MVENVNKGRANAVKIKLMKNLNKSKISFFFGRVFIYLMLLDLSYVFLYPILNMIVTSLKDAHDMLDVTVKWLPSKIEIENYTMAIKVVDLKNGFFNSIIITVLATFGHVMVSSFIGYGFARYKFPGINFLFALVVLNIIIPIQTLIVPMFYEMTQIFGIDSNLPMIIPAFFGYGLRGGLYVFLFRQYYINLPKELEESAHIDGCGKLGTHFRIILPISSSVVLVTIVLSMVWHWNDSFEAMVYLLSKPKQTLTQQVPYLMNQLTEIQQHVMKQEWTYITMFTQEEAMKFVEELSLNSMMMAALNICIFPILIVYIFLQKRFIQGIESAGIKG